MGDGTTKLVRCKEFSKDESTLRYQIQWGGNDDPRGRLTPGRVYAVEEVEPHTWHTKFHIRDDHGKLGRFNSVHFCDGETDSDG